MSLLLAITSGTVTVNVVDAGGIPSSGVIDQPTLTSELNVVGAGGIASSGAIGQPAVTSVVNVVDAGGIASSSAIGQPALTSEINVVDAGGVASSGAIGQPTVTEGSAVSIVDAGGIASSGAIGQPTVTEIINKKSDTHDPGIKNRQHRIIYGKEEEVRKPPYYGIRSAFEKAFAKLEYKDQPKTIEPEQIVNVLRGTFEPVSIESTIIDDGDDDEEIMLLLAA